MLLTMEILFQLSLIPLSRLNSIIVFVRSVCVCRYICLFCISPRMCVPHGLCQFGHALLYLNVARAGKTQMQIRNPSVLKLLQPEPASILEAKAIEACEL